MKLVIQIDTDELIEQYKEYSGDDEEPDIYDLSESVSGFLSNYYSDFQILEIKED